MQIAIYMTDLNIKKMQNASRYLNGTDVNADVNSNCIARITKISFLIYNRFLSVSEYRTALPVGSYAYWILAVINNIQHFSMHVSSTYVLAGQTPRACLFCVQFWRVLSLTRREGGWVFASLRE